MQVELKDGTIIDNIQSIDFSGGLAVLNFFNKESKVISSSNIIEIIYLY